LVRGVRDLRAGHDTDAAPDLEGPPRSDRRVKVGIGGCRGWTFVRQPALAIREFDRVLLDVIMPRPS
jgi:hypothetical protein